METLPHECRTGIHRVQSVFLTALCGVNVFDREERALLIRPVTVYSAYTAYSSDVRNGTSHGCERHNHETHVNTVVARVPPVSVRP